MMASVFGSLQIGPIPSGGIQQSLFGDIDIVREITVFPPPTSAGDVSFGTVPIVSSFGGGGVMTPGVIFMIVPFGSSIVTNYGELFPSNMITPLGSGALVSFGQISTVSPRWR